MQLTYANSECYADYLGSRYYLIYDGKWYSTGWFWDMQTIPPGRNLTAVAYITNSEREAALVAKKAQRGDTISIKSRSGKSTNRKVKVGVDQQFPYAVMPSGKYRVSVFV